jgi:NifU-like protein involved in Fe-S cluster formation
MAEVVNAPLYTIDILRLASDLPARCALEREDGRAELRSQTCGSVVAVAVTLDVDGRVEALDLEVQACAFGQASSALMVRSAAGRTPDEVAEAVTALTDWLEGNRADAGAWPGLEALAPARSRRSRHGAILLPFRALLAAIEGARP